MTHHSQAFSIKKPDVTKEPDPVSDFLKECDDFCKDAPMSQTTFSAKAMGGTYALRNLQKRHARMDEQMKAAREFMKSFASAKLAPSK